MSVMLTDPLELLRHEETARTSHSYANLNLHIFTNLCSIW
jgi:hypothetical protein